MNTPDPKGQTTDQAADQPPAPEEQDSSAQPDPRVAELEAALLESRDRMMRALADADNIRKRAMKERDDAGKYAVSSFAKDLLGFSDNFHRALSSIPPELKDSDARLANVMDGLAAMERDLLATLERHGIRKIEPLGEPFNANFHEVMFEAPMPGKPAGTVIQVIEPGYLIQDRLLRAAKVGIASASDGNPHQVDESA